MATTFVNVRRVAAAVGFATLLSNSALAFGPDSVADIAAPLLDAVVNISSSQTVSGTRSGEGVVPKPTLPEGSPFQDFFDEFFGDKGDAPGGAPHRVQSLGSGFVIDPSGIIVTNYHVIEDADEITANFTDGSKLPATLIGRDPKTDLALLRVESDKPLTSVAFGDSDAVRVGDWVMAIGNPFGLGGTLTLGIVSARNRNIQAGPYDDFIQTDASINRGNSGGPLFNLQGEVVGINTAIISPSGGSIGIGFAVPSEIAVNVLGQLRQFGETRRGWLGVRIQDVTDDVAKGLGLSAAKGALVASVEKDGPAASGGILAGDVIVSVDGRIVDAMNALPKMVAEMAVGQEVPVVVLREGSEQTLSVTLGRLEEAEQASIEPASANSTDKTEPDTAAPPVVVAGPLGLTLADLSPETRDQYGIKQTVASGVVVTAVEEGSAAFEKRLRPGDVIVEIGQERVASPADFDARLAALREEGRQNVKLVVQNKDGHVRWVNLPISAE